MMLVARQYNSMCYYTYLGSDWCTRSCSERASIDDVPWGTWVSITMHHHPAIPQKNSGSSDESHQDLHKVGSRTSWLEKHGVEEEGDAGGRSGLPSPSLFAFGFSMAQHTVQLPPDGLCAANSFLAAAGRMFRIEMCGCLNFALCRTCLVGLTTMHLRWGPSLVWATWCVLFPESRLPGTDSSAI